MLQTRQMRYFVAVAEELNFHRASHRLHISQPALWRQIRDLERDVGVALLDRQVRGIALTEAGRSFLEDCRDILERMEAARLQAQRVALGQVGTLNIGFNEIAGRRRELPRFLKEFREIYPGINLQLHVMMSQRQIEALRNHEIDAGFLFRHAGERNDFDSLIVGQDNFVLALPREHALARKPSLLLADLAGQPLIMPNPRNNGITHEKLVGAMEAAGYMPLVAQFADNENTLINLVAAGMGLAFVNSSCRVPHAQSVTLRPIADLTLPVALELTWLPSNLNPALPRFVALVDQLSGDLDQIEHLLETGMG
ncbi:MULTISPECIES: LysR substrate-binding domain-containing protein [unclassified Chelatococcus]|uniref:LysR family transcriptional regulator n=1 Tax=unclassified Chelatococcus TaxID=2638111 RepID=UPI001BCCD20C|nr:MULTISPECIES: LysR substrate-binding domain-containing protein [unclassified Chelatococcus]MBS7700119.1 LysR family transcriptional regulator [Chelatococcus sp. YT9]MBX3556812.1 LysR family transcriptional regulator [Chelatococcus sp.]